MVIIDDKPHNWPAAPPPYMQASGSRAQPKSESNNPYNSINNNLLSPATANSILPGPQRVHFVGENIITRNPDANRSTLSFTSHGNVDDPPPFSRGRRRIATLLDLPQHILLYIVQVSCLPRRSRREYDQYDRFHMNINPDAKGEYRGPTIMGGEGEYSLSEDEWAEHAVGLHHLAMNVRLVSRGLYVACMHVLRSTYLPLYSLNIKYPYTSDPFPSSTSTSTPTYQSTPYTYNPSSPSTPTPSTPSYTPANSSPLLTTHRETAILDRFLLLSLHHAILASESPLHLLGSSPSSAPSGYSSSSAYSDLFSLHQPTARLEDLVLHYGLQNGTITLAPSSSRLVSFDYVSIKLTEGGRRVGLVISDTKGRKRVICEYLREDKSEKLEISAKKLCKELAQVLKRSRRP